MNKENQPGNPRSVTVFGGAIRITFCVERESTDGRYSLYEITCEPGSGPPLHVHSDIDEAFYVVSGAFQFQIGEERLPAPAGWFGQGPRHIPHAFTACGSTPAKLVMVVSPGGLEEFFVGLGELTADREADMAKVTALFAEHGMTVVGPPVPVPGHDETA
ncbi:MAG: cupin domain-containing protein [Akkermansiaceae bacterium]|nr:cupin domain-containing protein [Akkermansiaceae bacterium]